MPCLQLNKVDTNKHIAGITHPIKNGIETQYLIGTNITVNKDPITNKDMVTITEDRFFVRYLKFNISNLITNLKLSYADCG